MPIGADQHAIGKRQHAFARRAEQRTVGVQPQHGAVLESFGEEPVLDLLGGEPHQAERVDMADRRGACHIERTGDHTARIDQRRGRAGQNPVALEEVLGAVHCNRLALDQRRADRIGAGVGFAPRHAGPQRHLRRTPRKFVGADHIEDDAGRIGENDDTAGQTCIALQSIEFRPREAAEPVVAFLKFAQFAGGGRLDQRRAAGVQPLAGAALPRP